MADEERRDSAEDAELREGEEPKAEQLEGESPEDRDKRFLAEKYGIAAPRRVLGAEAVFDTSIDGGTDSDLARAYPAVAAAATKSGSEDEAAMFEAESPNERQAKYEEVQGEKADEAARPSREELDEQFKNKGEIVARLKELGDDEADESAKREELLDRLEAKLDESEEREEDAEKIHEDFAAERARALAEGEAPPKQVPPSEQTDAMLAEAAKGEAVRENLASDSDALSDEDRAEAEAEGDRFVDTSVVDAPEGDVSVVGGGKFEDAENLADSEYSVESAALESLREKDAEVEDNQGTRSEAKKTEDEE